MTTEAQKALAHLKSEVLGEAVPAVTEQVLETIEKNSSIREKLFGKEEKQGSKAEKLFEAKQHTANILKALHNKDFASARAISDEFGSKAMSEGTDTAGGYAVPEIWADEVIRLAPEYGVVRRNAKIVNMSGVGDKRKYPTAGSVTAYRVNENTKITSSSPTLGQVTLEPEQVATLIPVSNLLLQDANVGVIDLLTVLSAEALANKEDTWGFKGEAAGEGIFQNTSVPVHTLATGNTTYVKTQPEDLLDIMSKVDESALPNAKWYMSFSVFIGLLKQRADAVSAGDSKGNFLITPPAGNMPATLWGYPVEFVKVLPKTSDASQAGTAYIAFGDLNYMYLGDKMTMSVDISTEATVTDTDGSTLLNLFERNMSAVRVIERIDIQLAEAGKAFAIGKTNAS
jgi:HK97 family phage major capsid protein